MQVLGLDIGIASCGWAVVKLADVDCGLVAAGVRCFDAPLVDKTGEPKSAQRRAARGQRRVIRRRAQRMSALRTLLAERRILDDASRDCLRDAARRAGDPWSLRSSAFERLLSRDEIALVLGHIARHRGFRSNSKRDTGANAPDETSKMKKAIEATREGLAKYRSFGEMLARDPRFAERKRNRDKDFSHTPLRSDLEAEMRAIFAAQRRFGNEDATSELEARAASAAFDQRPLQDIEDKVGPCPFEPDQRRTAKCAPSFERFRFLSRLANLRVGKSERALNPDEIAAAERAFGETKGFSFTRLRELIDLEPGARFAGIPADKESRDVAARNGLCAAGTRALREALGDPAPGEARPHARNP
jgi:CRISPR-associated endonuclease Csn1